MAFSSSSWTCGDVDQWLRGNGLDKCADFFVENQITGDSLLSLRTEHLFYLVKVFDDVFTLNDILKLEQCLNQLKGIPFGDSTPFPVTVQNAPALSSLILPPTSNEPNWQDGGLESNIRVMEMVYPDECWRYTDVRAIMKDYFPDYSAPGNTFLATATHVISPVDFYVQPFLVQPTVKAIEQRLQDLYSESTVAVPGENVFVGMPCVTRFKQNGSWYRAQVVDVVGTTEAPVKFVDWGHRQYSSLDDVKPLNSELGFPPGAIRCRVKGVRERTLEQKVLDAFHAEMESLGGEIRVEIVSSSTDPFIVEIFNRYTNENIGKKYLPKEPLCPKVPSIVALKKKKDREWTMKQENGGRDEATSANEMKVFASDMDAFMEGAFTGYSSSDDGQTGEIKRMNKKIRKIKHEEKMQAERKRPVQTSETEERNRSAKLPGTNVTFQRGVRRHRKPLTGVVDVRICHVESTQEIYVHILALEECCSSDAQESLVEIYGDPNECSIPNLPAEFVSVGAVCVVFDQSDKTWYRCRVVDVNWNGVMLQAVDTGKRLPPIPSAQYDRLKVMVSDPRLDTPPKAFHCRISELSESQPTPLENTLLREMLTVRTVMKGEFERTREPWRIKLWTGIETEKNFSDVFNEEVDELGLRDMIEHERRPRTEMALWQRPTYVEVKEKKVEKEKSERSAVHSHGSWKTATQHGAGGDSGGAEKVQTDHGYANDIEALLCGSVAVAGYESEEENEKAGFNKTGTENGTSIVRRVEEEEKDEKGSICEFPDEKKQLVAKWLEENSERKEGASGSKEGVATASKRNSVAMNYNPDLSRKPIGQRSVTKLEVSKKPTSSSEKGQPSKSGGTPRLPVQSYQVRPSVYNGFH